MIENEPLRQLRKSGYAAYLQQLHADGYCVRGVVCPELLPVLIARLKADCDHGKCGPWHLLHADVGNDRVEWRSYRRAYGEGSLQIVVSRETGRVYADVDAFSPYDDVVGVAGHLGADVAWPKLRSIAKKLWNVRKIVDWIRKDRQERARES